MINAQTNMTMAANEPVAPVMSPAPTAAIATIGTPSIGPEMDNAPAISAEPAIGGEETITMDDTTNRPYTNSPHEMVKTTRAAVPSGTDLARPKGTYPKVAGGDNPTHVAVDFD